MRKRTLDNDANCLQQRHSDREELVWHVFYFAPRWRSEPSDTAPCQYRFNQLARDDPLVTHDVAHLQDVDW